MWDSDNAVHIHHAELVYQVADIENTEARQLFCLRALEGAAAVSKLSDHKFRAWTMVMVQAAQNPKLLARIK